MFEKMKPTGLCSADFLNISQSENHWRLNKMVEVNVAHKYEKIWWKRLHQHYNVRQKRQMNEQTAAEQPASQVNTTDCIDLYVTPMEQSNNGDALQASEISNPATSFPLHQQLTR